MQTVKHVIEELNRFNPEARVEDDVEIKGHSPATQCTIRVVGSPTKDEYIEELEEKIEKMEEGINMAIALAEEDNKEKCINKLESLL